MGAIEEMKAATEKREKKKAADMARLADLVWADKDGDAMEKLGALYGFNQTMLTEWVSIVRQIRADEPIVADLPSRRAALAAAAKARVKAWERFDAESRRLEHELSLAKLAERAAQALVDDAVKKSAEISTHTQNLQIAMGQLDPGALARRRSLRQVMFTDLTAGDCECIDVEQYMQDPHSRIVPAREDCVALQGQTDADVDALHALVSNIAKDGRRSYYLLGVDGVARAENRGLHKGLVLLVDHEAKTKNGRATHWQTMQFPFPVSFDVATGVCSHQFVPAPGQSAEDLSARAAALLKWHRAWHAANKSAEWRSPAALESERFGGSYHRPLADRAAPMSERPS